MGIKETRIKILLSLFLLSDTSFSPVNFDERVQKVFDITFNQKTRGILSGLIKEGLIKIFDIRYSILEKEKEKKPISNIQYPISPDGKNKSNENSYYLTEKGFYSLCLEFPFFRFLKDSWDGKWRIISYEIPEAKREIRDRLRREMQGWGLGPWHRSFWLTPHPIIENLRQLIGGKEEEKYFQAFESEHIFGDRNILIEKVWGKSNLDKSYRELFKKWHAILSSQEEKIEKFKKVIDEYINLLKIDPGLPKELLGEKWIGLEGWSIFKEIRGILLS
ncbi:MAG: PaaX family transcriptional regulator C-terminal domain-containing protein [Microgenomates group bacterium]